MKNKDLKSIKNSNQIIEFPKFEGTKKEKIIQFLNHLNLKIDVFDDFITGNKKIDVQENILIFKFINFNLKTNKVEFSTMYSVVDNYPDNFNELLNWDSPELFQIANDLMI